MANPEHLEILRQGVKKWNRWRKENPEIVPDLTEANLIKANLTEESVSDGTTETDDVICHYRMETCIPYNLQFVDLSEADLTYANLSNAILKGANLSEAILRNTNFSHADLSEADLWDAVVSGTIFVDVYLSSVGGLWSVTHNGPSTIGIDTLYKSSGKI